MVLKISNLNKVYKNGFQSLYDVNIDIEYGEKVGLLGLNGAGKSSLVGILSGSVIKSTGQVLINNFNIENERIKASKSIGVVHQELIYDTFFDVKETLKLHAGYYGFEKYNDEIDELLKALDLYDKKNMNTRYLSGGMKRRLMIAKALIIQPKFIILDEPTVGIDVTQRDKMYEYISKLNKEKKIAILLTTHYMEEAEKLCDRIIIIHKGKIMADGPKHEIIGKFRVKETIFELDYLSDECATIKELEKIFSQNKILDYKFLFNQLSIFYNENDFSFDFLYTLIKSSQVNILDVKSSEGGLELAFKKIISD